MLDPLLDLGLRNLTVMLLVFFVPEHEEGKVVRVFRATLLEKVMLPVAQMIKRFLAGDIVYQDARLSASVESCAESLVALLTSSVPQLQSY